MEPQRGAVRYEAYICSNQSCRAYRWADIARLWGETHCIKCHSAFKKTPELRPVGGTKGAKGKGKANPSEAKGGNKRATTPTTKGGGHGKGGKSPPSPAKDGKVTHTFDRQKVDTDPVHKCRMELAFMEQLHGKESQKAQDAAAELENQLYLRDQVKTPSQRATDKRRQLKAARRRLFKDAAALDTAEEALRQAQAAYDAATQKMEHTAMQVDSLEEELQYLEEQFLLPQAATGPQRDLLAERAQETMDQAVRESGGQDEESAELQQLTNRMQEILDNRAAGPRKKKKTTYEKANSSDHPLPAVPHGESDGESFDARLDADIDEIDMAEVKQEYGTNPDPSRKTSDAILAKHASKATIAVVHSKSQHSVGKAAGKGGHKGAPNTSPRTAWGKGPTPAEAHGRIKRPGLQSPNGGEGVGETTTPDLRQASQDQEKPDTTRNQGGDEHL